MSNFDIERIKKEGEQERIRRTISSLNFDIQKSAEKILWTIKQPEVLIGNIREALENIETCFKHLEKPNDGE